MQKIKGMYKLAECFICHQDCNVDEAHLINFDGEVTALVCWRCYERNLDNMIITERGED